MIRFLEMPIPEFCNISLFRVAPDDLMNLNVVKVVPADGWAYNSARSTAAGQCNAGKYIFYPNFHLLSVISHNSDWPGTIIYNGQWDRAIFYGSDRENVAHSNLHFFCVEVSSAMHG